MKIGILGGSFDPPHNGHLHVAKTLLRNNYCQKIILVPCSKHPFDKPLSDAKHRLAMTRLLEQALPKRHSGERSDSRIANGNKRFWTSQNDHKNITSTIEISDLEIKMKSISYTIDTLKALKSQSPKDEFLWIMGEDQIENFTRWKGWKEIIKQFGLIVVARYKRHSGESRSAGRLQNQESKTDSGRASLARMTGFGITILSRKTFNPLHISSSEIRKRIKEGLSIDNLVSKRVEKYIIKHKLYL